MICRPATLRADHWAAVAQAMENAVKGYGERYAAPSASPMDGLAEEFSYSEAGEKLGLARDRVRLMVADRTAADCDYVEPARRVFACNFVLDAFDGKVASILARLGKDGLGRLEQEVRDAFTLVNFNGKGFRDARISAQYLDARLDELRWGAAVLELKARDREEQRAAREQIRDEQRAQKEYDRAVKQAEKEEAAVAKALDRLRREYEQAGDEDRARYAERLAEMEGKLSEAEEKNRRAKSNAEQTRRGHVYVISNVGSFGESIFKIGLTRRQNPEDRVVELGGASVPFGFDIHGMIRCEDAPALETALHRRFVGMQVNKANRRKEFFRLSLADIRAAVDDMDVAATWTERAAAREYRETLALEQAMRDDPMLKLKWADDQADYEAEPDLDEEPDADAVPRIHDIGASA